MPLNDVRQFQRSSFLIPRRNDKEILDIFDAIVAEGGYGVTKSTYLLTFADQTFECPNNQKGSDFDELLGKGTVAFRTLTYHLNIGIDIRVERSWEDNGRKITNNQDVFAIVPNNQSQINPISFASVIALARKYFKAVDSKPFMDYLDEGTRQLYQAREQDIQRLEQMQEQFFASMQSFTLDQQEKQQEFQRTLENNYATRQTHLEAQHQERLNQFEIREAELKKIRAEIDERENRQARRDIYKDLKIKLEQRNKKFELTEGTKKLRSNVKYFTIGLLAVFGLGLIFCFYKNVMRGESEIHWLVVANQIGLAIAFLGSATFFIRWNHQWFQKHADEEFRLKRLDLDIDRANWLVELALEWKNITKSDIPSDLIDKLARSLFISDETKDIDINPAETLFTALLGKSGTLNIEPGKVSLQRTDGGMGGKKGD